MKQLARKNSRTTKIQMEPLHIGIKPDAQLGLADYDATTLFEEGLRMEKEGRCEKALPFYTRLLHEFPSSLLAPASGFHAGGCFESIGQNEQAMQIYDQVLRHFPNSLEWFEVGYRKAILLNTLKKPLLAIETIQSILLKAAVPTADRLDALEWIGELYLGLNKHEEAERCFRRVIRLFEQQKDAEYLDSLPAAQAEFFLAQVKETRYRKMPLRLPEKQMMNDLEVKASLLLQVQAGYLRAIRYGKPEWATAAGVQIANLYVHLHSSMEQAPLPPGLTLEECFLYKELLRRRTSVLLRKALRIFEMTLEIASQTGEENEWTQSARHQMALIEKLLLSLYQSIPVPTEEASPK